MKIECPCGNELNDISHPNPCGGHLISDSAADEISIPLDYGGIIKLGRSVWECPRCGRLAVDYPRKQDVSVKWYTPDDGIYRGVTR